MSFQWLKHYMPRGLYGRAALILLLPVLSALTYALNQLMTRKLGVEAKASAMAVYIQATFIVVSLGFFVVAGDGRFAEGQTNESLIFLLRAWSWPTSEDWPYFIGLGINSAIIGYCLSQAYRLTDAETIAPYEYVVGCVLGMGCVFRTACM